MTLEALFSLKTRTGIAALAFAVVVMPLPAASDPFIFSTGNPDGLMATATRPESPGKFEIETSDDFALTQETLITGAAFTGLIPLGASPSDIKNVVVEVYRVFPADSNVGRTSGPPTFSTPNVPTRVNSPSDVAFDQRQFSAGSPGLAAIVLNSSFTANNSVKPGGIHPLPNVFTGGNGPVTGQETQISVNFTTPFAFRAFASSSSLSHRRLTVHVGEGDRLRGEAGSVHHPTGYTAFGVWTWRHATLRHAESVGQVIDSS